MHNFRTRTAQAGPPTVRIIRAIVLLRCPAPLEVVAFFFDSFFPTGRHMSHAQGYRRFLFCFSSVPTKGKIATFGGYRKLLRGRGMCCLG